MLVREVYSEEKQQFNQAVSHPLQSWEWGEFRRATGLKIIRLGVFDQKKLNNAYQLTVHPIPVPKLNLKVIYFPKGPMPDETMFSALNKLGRKEEAVFIRMEPNIGSPLRKGGPNKKEKFKEIKDFLLRHGCQPGRLLFTRYTFKINLNQSEEELLGPPSAKETK